MDAPEDLTQQRGVPIMASKAIKDDSEYRRIRRMWAKGEMFADQGVKLVMRDARASESMTLPLEPLRVKAHWNSSNTQNVLKRVVLTATALGLTDVSFCEWFAVAAPDEIKDILKGDLTIVGTPEPLRRWVEARTVPKVKPRKPTRVDKINWEAVRQVLLVDRSPMDAAVAAGCAGTGTRWFQDPKWLRALEEQGLPLDADPLPLGDPEFGRSVRVAIALEGEGVPLAEIARRLGIHQESLLWRFRARRLGRLADRAEVRAMIYLWLQGASSEAISESTGVNRNGVHMRLADYAPRPGDDKYVSE
jgi:hypothetical protein